jgi:UDP-glucose 4-epimerase
MSAEHPIPKTILLTGGCGYIGSQLLADLAKDERFAGVALRVVDNLHSGSLTALKDLPASGRYEYIHGDILNPDILKTALFGVDTVIHLAAIVRSPMNFENPEWLQQVNLWGTSQLVQAAKTAGVQKFVYLSSTAVYGPGGPFGISDRCQPMGAYAVSKFQAEQRVWQGHKGGLPALVMRLGTVYGEAPVTRYDALVNRFALLSATNQTLPIYGSGEQLRPIVHVRDASKAIRDLLAEFERHAGKCYNVVSESISVLEVLRAVLQFLPNVRVRHSQQEIRNFLSFEVLANELFDAGWVPQENLLDGLREMLGRFRGFELSDNF